jgi:hypothetical protein
VGTAAAAGTYPTDTEACADLGHFLDCTIAADQAACEANTNCQYVKDEEMGYEVCTPSDAINVVTENALNNATAALESQFEICGAFTVEEDCVGACAWQSTPMNGMVLLPALPLLRRLSPFSSQTVLIPIQEVICTIGQPLRCVPWPMIKPAAKPKTVACTKKKTGGARALLPRKLLSLW